MEGIRYKGNPQYEWQDLIFGEDACHQGAIKYHPARHSASAWPWVLCRLYHALRQPTRLGTVRPVSTPLSVKIMKKVGGPKAKPAKRVQNRDVIHVTGITSIPSI